MTDTIITKHTHARTHTHTHTHARAHTRMHTHHDFVYRYESCNIHGTQHKCNVHATDEQKTCGRRTADRQACHAPLPCTVAMHCCHAPLPIDELPPTCITWYSSSSILICMSSSFFCIPDPPLPPAFAVPSPPPVYRHVCRHVSKQMCMSMFLDRREWGWYRVVLSSRHDLDTAHNYIGHSYTGHNYTGHEYLGHNNIPSSAVFSAPRFAISARP